MNAAYSLFWLWRFDQVLCRCWVQMEFWMRCQVSCCRWEMRFTISFYFTLIYLSISSKLISHSGSRAGQCIWGCILSKTCSSLMLININYLPIEPEWKFIYNNSDQLTSLCNMTDWIYLMTISGNYSCYTFKSAQGIIENLTHFCSMCCFFSCYAMERKRQLEKRWTINNAFSSVLLIWEIFWIE